jgi:hypothetical protein
MTKAKTHSIANSELDGRPENQEPMFNVESIKAISNSLIPKIAFRVGGSLLAEAEALSRQVYNLFDNAEDGERMPEREQTEYIPRMDRVQFWKGFAIEHGLHVPLDGFKRFKQDEMNLQFEKLMNSEFKRDNSIVQLKEKATEFTKHFAIAETKWDEIAPRFDYSAAFESMLYEVLQDAINTTRTGVEDNRYPFRDMEDDELKSILFLIDDLESQI